jgi:truncated hemoglobin YjbI
MTIKSNYTEDQLIHWVTIASKEFYELVYKDEWLSQVFSLVEQNFITKQQTDFMLGLLGGPKLYSGRNASDAHPHIYVDEHMWQVRETLLNMAFDKIDFPDDLRKKWLKIDEAFKRSIVMQDPSQCKKRFTTDQLIIIPPPTKKAS